MTAQGCSIRTGWAALAACAALLCLAAIAPASALAGSISGTVTEAGTATPVEGVEVCAWMEVEEEWDYGCDYSEADGSYAIPNLDPGSYFVEFWAGEQGYRTEYVDSVLSAAATPSSTPNSRSGPG